MRSFILILLTVYVSSTAYCQTDTILVNGHGQGIRIKNSAQNAGIYINLVDFDGKISSIASFTSDYIDPNIRNSLHFIARSGKNIKFATSTDLNYGYCRLTILNNGNVGIGTETPQSKLAVNGTVTAKQVKVTQTGWPDYVFDTAYSLSSLEKTAAYIQANKHLPDIPSAKEIRNEGLNLGDMQKKQMRKIEELTLYAIAREKQLKSQQQLIAQLTEALHQQEIRIRKLEKKLKE